MKVFNNFQDATRDATVASSLAGWSLARLTAGL